MSEEQELLKEWCDRLVSLQITEWNDKEFYGGIMCPSCGRIHGRCSDAIYPMMYMAKESGDSKYLDCARRLFAWSSNMFRRDGCCYNDTNSNWRGITVFSEIQLGEALLAFGDLLDKEEYTVWKDQKYSQKGRMFNPVGGMQALDCRICLKKGVPVSIQIRKGK